jgi:hypothetical protein
VINNTKKKRKKKRKKDRRNKNSAVNKPNDDDNNDDATGSKGEKLTPILSQQKALVEEKDSGMYTRYHVFHMPNSLICFSVAALFRTVLFI